MSEPNIPLHPLAKSAEDRMVEDAHQLSLEPAHSEDVVLGAEIGGVGGAVTGAIAGSALGLPGAITGAVIGGVLGAAGSAAAVAAVDKIDDDGIPEDSIIPDPANPDLYAGDELQAPSDKELQGEPSEPRKRMIPDKDRPENPPEPPAELDPDARPNDGVPYPDPTTAETVRTWRKL